MTQLVHLDIHPDLNPSDLRELVLPGRPLWTPHQLRDLTREIIARHAAPLRAVARYTEPDRWWTRLALTRAWKSGC